MIRKEITKIQIHPLSVKIGSSNSLSDMTNTTKGRLYVRNTAKSGREKAKIQVRVLEKTANARLPVKTILKSWNYSKCIVKKWSR